ncbi:NAD(P)-dependent oxidoreductase [Kiloniella sp.]|uniref:NAD(P)-dependent oxidoreductase n=1 Tax=Kiloniella sp. TaxID=1938587 RepID=UPI003B02499B
MAVLIDIRDPLWMDEADLRDFLQKKLPDVTFHIGFSGQVMEDVTVLVAVKLFPDVVQNLPNLQFIQKLGAGVDTILKDTELPEHVRLARIRSDTPAREIAEFCLAYVLQTQRNILEHAADQKNAVWQPRAPRESLSTTVAVLGLGHIGKRTAQTFARLDYKVIGWSQSDKDIDGVQSYSGLAALTQVLGQADHVISILPSTESTRSLFRAERFSQFKAGATFINVGRGDLIDDADLIDALNEGPLGLAVLDVFHKEPLPTDHPFWRHPNIIITPHVSGWHLTDGLDDVAINIGHYLSGGRIVNEVDRALGY